MTLQEFRVKMAEYRRSVDEEARYLKDSYLALDRLRALYTQLDSNERQMADQVLGEWALSNDEGTRFDALALIGDLRVRTATHALQELARRLDSSTSPGAPYELKKVNRLLEALRER